jgi:cysteine synthase A
MVKGIVADPVGSTIGGGEEGCYNIEGIGNNFMPETLDTLLIDEFIKIKDEEALKLIKELARKEGLIVGSSSGAAMAAALKLTDKIDKGNIVVVLADRGDRYFSKNIYS